MTAACHSCKRTLAEGETAWANDWTVLDTTGTEAKWRTEVRYTCDDCSADYMCARCGLPTNRDTAPSPCETHDICADCTPCDDECRHIAELDAADEHAAQQRRDAP